MSDGIAEMNKAKTYTREDGRVYTLEDSPEHGLCYGCDVYDEVKKTGERCPINGDICQSGYILKLQTPLDKARERLEQAGTPLVADVRTFDTGATRDTDEGKPRYHAYSCPLVDQKRGEYMLKHQNIGTDKERIADNWKKRMPLEEILESLIRHVKDLELHHDGYVDQCREKDIHEVLDGIWANTTFYHHGIIQDEIDRKKPF